ncbi:VWA domain-containing protein [Edaphobacter flagellatus]|uniref:VWA domain-containing protein n=1 Tax=Edaphobacter flagellatus TaxID=1933044 RepID=UPI0021B457E1|nr:VWA domain-containing protein [Edaphobacter flagellatus]
MRARPAIPHLYLVALLLLTPGISSQNTTYHLKVAVDEVEFTFHATDTHGLPVNDLKLDELRLFDNGHAPRRILIFQSLRDLPIRAGILLDTSSSMEKTQPADQAIATAYLQRILEQKTDQAFVMSFGRQFHLQQTWSGNPAALIAAVHHAAPSPSTTAIFDTLYAACRFQFGKLDHAATGNFILLFSDGEDDASFLSLEDAANMCQQTNTAIYAFRADSNANAGGARNLIHLASLTGGRVFRDSESASDFEEDLRLIHANLRNQYRIVYNPADLKRDGAFHSVALLPPDRVASVNARSGYYAPKH